MITKLFSVYDSKAQIFHRPLHALTKGEALRTFIDECKRPESQLCLHPEDYSLFELGWFDDASGKLAHLDAPFCLGTALELVAQGQAA